MSRRPKDPKSFLADKISEKISEGNIKGAVRLASSDCSLIPPDAETASILRDKHPSKAPSSSSAVTSSLTTTQYHTDESEVLQAIRSFPNGSGGGLDGLKPQHLKDLVGSGGREHESRLLKSLTHFVNLVLDRCVPQEIRSIFFGASLCALRKKDGGVRPIAIGNTLRRLISPRLLSEDVLKHVAISCDPISWVLVLDWVQRQLSMQHVLSSRVTAITQRC